MADKITLHTKKLEVEKMIHAGKKDDKDIFIDIKIEENQEFNFDKLEKGQKSKDKIKIKWRKHGAEAKDEKEYREIETEVLYDGGPFKHSFKLPKDITFGAVKSENPSDKSISTDKHSFKLTAYVSLVALLVAIGLFIWWWFSSSKKDEKEEESL